MTVVKFRILRVSARFRNLQRRLAFLQCCAMKRRCARPVRVHRAIVCSQGSSLQLFLLPALFVEDSIFALAVCFRNVMFRVAVVQCLFFCRFAHATPVVDLKLSPAAAALPDIVAQIAGLDAARVAAEEEALGRLDAAYAAASSKAEAQIQFAERFIPRDASTKLIPTSLLARSAAGSDFRVEVLPAPSVSNRIRKRIALVERIRNIEESRLVDQAVGEFQMLVDLATRELKTRLSPASHRGVSFLDKDSSAAPAAVDVRLLPPDGPFPTVAGLVAEMEQRRDVAEDRVRQRITELQMKLVKHMGALVAEAIA